jgi:hypothetical protein
MSSTPPDTEATAASAVGRVSGGEGVTAPVDVSTELTEAIAVSLRSLPPTT